MDMYAYYTRQYMEKYGLTQTHFAKIAVKSHKNGANNPHAQYQTEVTREEVLGSGEVAYPLTRMMCSPIGDGAGAAIVCSREMAKKFTQQPIWIAASVMGSGQLGDDMSDTLTRRLGAKAPKNIEIMPNDITSGQAAITLKNISKAVKSVASI